MKLIVGLGNRGPSYTRTRHNVGFWVVDRVAERHRLRFSEKDYRSRVARGRIGEADVVMLKPQTFMNASGEAVGRARRDLRLDPEEILVVYDDLDLRVGRVRIRQRGSAGGHRGVESVIEALGSKEFPRVRVGVGRPPGEGEPIDYLLDAPGAEDAAILQEAVDRAADAIEVFLGHGIVSAMNRFNAHA
jgi:PTH1 family peptidyl-tRNA hydrolase